MTLALVDTDPRKQDLMTTLAQRMNRDAGEPFHIVGSTRRRDVLEGFDYVVTSPAIL